MNSVSKLKKVIRKVDLPLKDSLNELHMIGTLDILSDDKIYGIYRTIETPWAVIRNKYALKRGTFISQLKSDELRMLTRLNGDSSMRMLEDMMEERGVMKGYERDMRDV